eukprot:6048441-Prymnesium_polylepis.2
MLRTSACRLSGPSYTRSCPPSDGPQSSGVRYSRKETERRTGDAWTPGRVRGRGAQLNRLGHGVNPNPTPTPTPTPTRTRTRTRTRRPRAQSQALADRSSAHVRAPTWSDSPPVSRWRAYWPPRS